MGWGFTYRGTLGGLRRVLGGRKLAYGTFVTESSYLGGEWIKDLTICLAG